METKAYPEAKRSFERVLDGRGNYEMDFNAKLYLTKLGIHDGPDSERRAIAQLEKMIKDQKNIEYRDQLYYTLAQIQLEKNNRPEAINYLKKAVVQKSNNQIRKAESYYLLADLFYEDENYVNAKNYFDTTLQVLPQIDERYPRVQQLAGGLTDIARHLETIAQLDSFIQVSKMSNEEKRELAMQIKKKREKEANKAANIAANQENQNNKLGASRISNPVLNAANTSSNSSSFLLMMKEN